MPKSTITEVEVLRFFETESLDRTTILFNIVSDKMRTRLQGNREESPLSGASSRRSKNGRSPEAQQKGSNPADKIGAATDRSEGGQVI